MCGGLRACWYLSTWKIIKHHRQEKNADCFDNLNRPKRDCWRKDVIAISHNEGLKITIDTNLTTTDFLDVTLDHFAGKCDPYRKPDGCPFYVNVNYNHPSTILKQLPPMVNTCLLSLFMNKMNSVKQNLYMKRL